MRHCMAEFLGLQSCGCPMGLLLRKRSGEMESVGWIEGGSVLVFDVIRHEYTRMEFPDAGAE